MYKNIKLSTVEFKRTGISGKDFTVQSRKNLSLGRCLQEAHAAYGFKVVSVIMGDVAGIPNTASTTQVTLNVRPDRPDFRVAWDDAQIAFGEVTRMA
ncbi:hypothetical protein BGZ90_003196 [Linnemannia elongata]|nr:hypothetical protein BGZ90_003196 [Linnemannia elongata]